MAESACQPFPVENECKIHASKEQIEIVRVTDTKVHLQSLFERGSLQGRYIRDQHSGGSPDRGDKEKAREETGDCPHGSRSYRNIRIGALPVEV